MLSRVPKPERSLGAAGPAGSERYLNRELATILFNERVFALATKRDLPLLERVRFLAILSRNLDELFQVRVAGLKEQLLASPPPLSLDGLSPADQLAAIRSAVESLVERQDACWTDDLQPRLAAAGIRIVTSDELSKADRDHLDREYEERIYPVLTPLAVDPAHPFPYISHLSLNLAVMVRDPMRRRQLFARIKVPPLLPRFIRLPGPDRFIPLEQVIAMHVQTLFPGMEVLSHQPFRVTRDADIELGNDEAEDLLEAIQTELRRHSRQAAVVRLEVDETMTDEALGLLMRELDLGPSDVYRCRGLLDLGGLWSIYALDRPDLKAEPWTPVTPRRLLGPAGSPPEIFGVLAASDVLMQLPYDSFSSTVEAFIDHAARDPQVLAIKQTLYRTSGHSSPIANSLIRAAEAGKQVVALVELQARGDEEANIAWARALEAAGVHVVYGVVGLKTHAKVTLVVRQEDAGIRRYVHIGTGNYNPQTATIYEDLGVLSADPDLGADVAELFNFLTGYSRQRRFRRLLVAPMGLRSGLMKLIRRESRPGGRITVKVNNLVDQDMIDALYAASAAGARVDLLVRSACCLRPGVPGLSENIRVRSIVGRFLEHSRVFRFGEGEEADHLLGSADLMPRNLDRRVEAVVPVLDPGIRRELDEILEVCFEDDVLAWEMEPDGTWRKVPIGRGLDSQQAFCERAAARSRG